jgi:phage anti-repressor protein
MNVTTNELIPISDNNGKKAVNARDLHSFLESKRD